MEFLFFSPLSSVCVYIFFSLFYYLFFAQGYYMWNVSILNGLSGMCVCVCGQQQLDRRFLKIRGDFIFAASHSIFWLKIEWMPFMIGIITMLSNFFFVLLFLVYGEKVIEIYKWHGKLIILELTYSKFLLELTLIH